MSGEGKNQGKLYATTKWGEEGWKFEEFRGKFKDFFDTVIKYDERADKVIVAGKGVPSSISNVDGAGIISKSGSESWYNFTVCDDAYSGRIFHTQGTESSHPHQLPICQRAGHKTQLLDRYSVQTIGHNC